MPIFIVGSIPTSAILSRVVMPPASGLTSKGAVAAVTVNAGANTGASET